MPRQLPVRFVCILALLALLALAACQDADRAVAPPQSPPHFNTATDSGTWTLKAPMPTPRWGLGVGEVNGVLYAIGGANQRAVEAYDPASDSWSVKAPMPAVRQDLGVGVVNGIIYALGGEGPPAGLATVEAYDPATGTWTAKPSMINRRLNLGAGVVNGILYAIGGYNHSSFEPVAPVEAYEQ